MKDESSLSEGSTSTPSIGHDLVTRRRREAFRLPLAPRCQSPADYGRLCLTALGGIVLEALGSFPFFFAPGWANGWPGGLTIYQVWSTWLTLTLFVMLTTFGVAVGSLVSLFCCLFPRARRRTGILFGVCLVIWTILSGVACAKAFREIYALTLQMWPNGYLR